MKFSRRQAMGILAGGVAAGLGGSVGLPAARAQSASPPAPSIPPGPFQATRQSLAAFKVPDWYRDAKFGMWAHWGPQSAAEDSDWYARRMYIQGEFQYKHHLEHYGHPSKTGYVDVIKSWKADQFDADYLLGLYKKAGARYFVSMGCHHDNFDLWNSKYQPRWNAAASGPKKDIVGLFKKAAEAHGLRFGVSEHLSNSFCWFGPAHGSDTTGPLAGVPYDGSDPQYADLYHDYSRMPADFVQKVVHAPAKGAIAMSVEGPPAWRQNYFDRINDLITQYEPDLLYTDGGIPFGDFGLALVAHLYNTSARRHGGNLEAIYCSKSRADAAAGMCLLDHERGVENTISPTPWQTDTCIGNWHYDRRVYNSNGYRTPKFVIDMLVDIVSRNGNLQLNIPLPNNGMPDDKELKVIDGITQWMAINSQAIHGSRPYKIVGEGPGLIPAPMPAGQRFNEATRKALVAEDIRFTTNGDTLYAFSMGWAGREAVIPTLATSAAQGVGRIQNVELLGAGKLPFTQDESGLKIQLPQQPPCEHAVTFKIAGAIQST
jgi:alpha-L-fucosidase